ncbi:hypothetical protein TIFTF001_033337 [Ficus carica]|uniref:Uncharacterized protein n=1 Tax=Ficus carica TaxID=3494 RepID=A0AA88J3K5_FICCA|nr:hypothetical protein TIFTF001_033337 [Ficus carica]
MAAISPDGRCIAAAAFTADVKVWEIVYSKDGSFKEVSKFCLGLMVDMCLLNHVLCCCCLECRDMVMLFSKLEANHHSIQGWLNKNLEYKCYSNNGMK